jgi:hypothetical protein
LIKGPALTAEKRNAHNPRGFRLLASSLLSRILIGVLLFAAGSALSAVALRSRKPGAQAESEDRPGSGVTLQTECVDIWLPIQLDELARREFKNPTKLSDESLNLLVRKECGDSLWYALTLQHYDTNRRQAEITSIEYPFQSARKYLPLHDLMAMIAAGSKNASGSDSAGPRVHIIPPELLKLPPREALEELLRKSEAQAN